MHSIVSVMFLLFLLSGATAVNASTNLAAIFDSARMVSDSQKKQVPYRLYLGELKKINGQWRVESQQTLFGSQRKITQELEGFISFEEAFEQLNIATSKLDATRLYACQSHGCGRSNGWANHYFQVRQLYGLDNYQAYQVWKVELPNKKIEYWVLYLVERGNKRIYFQVDHISDLETVEANPVSPYDALQKNGFMVFDGLIQSRQGWSLDGQRVQNLATFLSQNSQINLRLVGHDYRGDLLKQQQLRSEAYALKLKHGLIAEGVSEKRLSVFGLGSLAPAGKVTEARIEIISVP